MIHRPGRVRGGCDPHSFPLLRSDWECPTKRRSTGAVQDPQPGSGHGWKPNDARPDFVGFHSDGSLTFLGSTLMGPENPMEIPASYTAGNQAGVIVVQ
jgi:hypothetical protein